MAQESEHRQAPMGRSDADTVFVRDFDLCRDLIGKATIADFISLSIKGVLPGVAERELLDAMVVTLVEHGLTPSTLAARLTNLGSPDQDQAAVAAGLLGAGARYLGSMGDAARVLQEAHAATDSAEAGARWVLDQGLDAIPGLGHPIHRSSDPRTIVLFSLAKEKGVFAGHCEIMQRTGALLESAKGRRLPINAAGAIAAIASDLGYPWQSVRGIALIARTIGILGHLADERERPIAMEIWDAARSRYE